MRTLVFQTLAVILLPLIFGIDGIWYSIVVAELLAFAVTALFILGQRKRYHYWLIAIYRGICGEAAAKVFARLFQKAAQSRARSPCRLRRGEMLLLRVSFLLSFFLCASSAKEKSGHWGKINVMGFAFPHKAFPNCFPLFFWCHWRKRKANKRKRRGLFRACERDQRSARWMGGRFLKKAT